MSKLLKLSETKAIRMEGVQINGAKSVSIRQMYCKKTDPTWKPTRNGINVPIENAEKIAKYLKQIAEGDDFKEISMNKD